MKTAAEIVTNALSKAPARGLTARQIATRTRRKVQTVRDVLTEGVDAGTVRVVGRVAPQGPGRPANLYRPA